MTKPHKNEFPVDSADDMDEAAIKILLRVMQAGKTIQESMTSVNNPEILED